MLSAVKGLAALSAVAVIGFATPSQAAVSLILHDWDGVCEHAVAAGLQRLWRHGLDQLAQQRLQLHLQPAAVGFGGVLLHGAVRDDPDLHVPEWRPGV